MRSEKEDKKKKSPFTEKAVSLLSMIARLVFVPKCVICKDVLEGEGELCCECRELFEKGRRKRCPICGKTARGCKCRPIGLEYTDSLNERRMSALAFYQNSQGEELSDVLMQRLVYAIKNDPDRSSVRLVGRDLSHEILRSLVLAGEDKREWKLTYAPRSKRRIKRYGFDQGREMAKMISRYTGIELEETLKNSGSVMQKKLNSLERRQNARESYSIKKGCVPKGNYIIVDDVITTGATVDACARLLKEGGAQKVYPVCIARTKMKKRKVRRASVRPWFRMK